MKVLEWLFFFAVLLMGMPGVLFRSLDFEVGFFVFPFLIALL